MRGATLPLGADSNESMMKTSSLIRAALFVALSATDADTIRAINQADLDHYISKPWTPEELHAVVREQLTEYVLRNVEDVLPYVAMLDGARLLERVARDTL